MAIMNCTTRGNATINLWLVTYIGESPWSINHGIDLKFNFYLYEKKMNENLTKTRVLCTEGQISAFIQLNDMACSRVIFEIAQRRFLITLCPIDQFYQQLSSNGCRTLCWIHHHFIVHQQIHRFNAFHTR